MRDATATAPRWTRPAEFLVYLVPVGGIPSDLFAAYARLLRAHSELPLRSLTRPGGYAAELSPFRSLDWGGPGALRFRFVATSERVDSVDGEDAQACRRVVGVLGVCHSPSLPLRGGLGAAHAQFEASVRRFPSLLLHKCFAFEHSFDDATARECEGLDDLVMFPVHHELQGMGESTVSLHLQVVMDTLAVNLLMALESVIRSATSSAVAHALTPKAVTGDLATALLDVNVEPRNAGQQAAAASPVVLSRDGNSGQFSAPAASPPSRSSLSSGPSFSSIPSPLAAGVGAISALDPRNRRRKRQLARREKLLGDYCVLVSCVSDAVDHYTVSLEMLREEERRSGGAPGDALWLAAALEAYAYCLYAESQDKFSTELVEKASEAVGFYAKAGTTELESLLIENIGWYYAGAAMATLTRSSLSGEANVLESLWVKRLLWDVLERGLMLFPELPTQRQVEFLVQASRMLEHVGHRRRVALFLHEAASLLLGRNAPSVDGQMRLLLSPTSLTPGPQRQRDLEAALMLERVAAARLGIREIDGRYPAQDEVAWEVTTLYRKNKTNGLPGKDASTSISDNSWLVIRFHVLRQLLTIARMLGDALLVGTYCLQLLEMLVWCDSLAEGPTIESLSSSLSPRRMPVAPSTLLVDHLQQSATSLRAVHAPTERAMTGLHAKGGVYFLPPPGIDTRVKRNFINSPSATMSNAAASLSSTLTNTPRILTTPRQQFSAAVNAISTKASPAFTPFGHIHHNHNGATPGRSVINEERWSAPKMPNIVEARDTASAGMYSEATEPKSARTIGAADGEGDGRTRVDPLSETSTVWNLRSQAEITKIERKLLGLLELDCTTLRFSEQVQLPTFLRVNKLKLRSSCNLEHPFLSRTTALSMFGVLSASSQQKVKSDFFYSPFEKKQKMRKTDQQGGGQDDDDDDIPAMYERAFPVHERVALQLTLSNPMGVIVKLQQVKAWVEFVEETSTDNREDESFSTTRSDGVECYSCFSTLEPYQKGKTVILGIQPLRVGTFRVRGCFITAFNITTSFSLRNPFAIRVVNELPMVSLSIRESGSMGLSGGDKAVKPQQASTAKLRIAMFANEIKRCTVRVRSTGNRPITNYRLAVTIQQRRAAKKTCVIYDNLPPQSDGTTDTSRQAASSDFSTVTDKAYKQVKTQAVTLRCGKLEPFPLPLASGGIVSIPFEASLRRNFDQVDPSEDNIQLEWSIVYADETGSDISGVGNAEDTIFYRESKLVVELVTLPSLMLQSISLLPCSAEKIPYPSHGDGNYSAQLVTTDHSFCVILVHVVNPTATTFLFRIRRRTRHPGKDDSAATTCEAEIGRHCSRQLAVEIPRVQTMRVDQQSMTLIEVLNSRLEMEWETYFGTLGRLRCEECHIAQTVDQEQEQLELQLPLFSFQVLSPQENSKTPVPSEVQNGCMTGGDKNDVTASCHCPSCFQVAHMRVWYRKVQIGLFQSVPIVILIQRRLDSGNIQPVLTLEVEVVITEEGEGGEVSETSGHVMVTGMLKAHVCWDDPTDETMKRHDVQCMFLSEGNYCVAVRGRVLATDLQFVGAEVWCHQPMHIEVGAECADVEKRII